MGKREQKQGPPPGPSKTAARRQLAAVGTAGRHRLAVKQAKMATARRYTTGQQSIMVNEHRTAKRKEKLTTVAAQNSKHEFIPTTSNRNKVSKQSKTIN